MFTTTNNRVAAKVAEVRDALARGQRLDGRGSIDPADLPGLEATLAVTFQEHFAYQNAQARAHATGVLTTEEAQVVYVALGEVGDPANGGWAADTDLATKVVVTNLMGQLIGRAS